MTGRKIDRFSPAYWTALLLCAQACNTRPDKHRVLVQCIANTWGITYDEAERDVQCAADELAQGVGV